MLNFIIFYCALKFFVVWIYREVGNDGQVASDGEAAG